MPKHPEFRYGQKIRLAGAPVPLAAATRESFRALSLARSALSRDSNEYSTTSLRRRGRRRIIHSIWIESPPDSPTGGSTALPILTGWPTRRAGDPQVPYCGAPGESICPTGDPKLPSAPPSQQTAPAGTDPRVVIREAVATLELPAVDPKVGPDPSINRWNIVPVGQPLWLWHEGPDQITTNVTQQGITIQMTAVRTKTVFEMGNGDKVTCTKMSKWRKPLYLPPPKSPNCGYTYPRLPKERGAGFNMTVTAHWTVTWATLGQTGTLPLTRSQVRHMPVGELQAVIVPNRPQPS